MITHSPGKYTVTDTETKEVISVHEFTDEYTRKKAKEAATNSNDEWKTAKSGGN